MFNEPSTASLSSLGFPVEDEDLQIYFLYHQSEHQLFSEQVRIVLWACNKSE
jgi:hypothetical protein